MLLMCLVPWPANTEPAWPLTLRLGAARTSHPVELCGPNLPLQSAVQASFAALWRCSNNNNAQSFLQKSSIRLSNSALLGPRCWWRQNNMRDVSRKTFQLRHFKTWSPDWYANLTASKLVTKTDLNWPLKKLGTPCKQRTLQRNSACKSTPSIASQPLRMHSGPLVVLPQIQRADVPIAWPSSRGITYCRDCRARLDQRGRDPAAK